MNVRKPKVKNIVKAAKALIMEGWSSKRICDTLQIKVEDLETIASLPFTKDSVKCQK